MYLQIHLIHISFVFESHHNFINKFILEMQFPNHSERKKKILMFKGGMKRMKRMKLKFHHGKRKRMKKNLLKRLVSTLVFDTCHLSTKFSFFLSINIVCFSCIH